MCPEPNLSRQQGAGLPVAIFIITVLALIVTSMAQQQESSGAAVSQQILSQRAFYAAESGAQAAVTEVLHEGGCGSVPSSLDFTQAGLKNCSARLECSSVQADIDGDSNPETVFTLISEGQCGSGAEETSRTVEVRVR
ncbi:MAG: pilus assembly PilX family protein [Marinobacter sp.]